MIEEKEKIVEQKDIPKVKEPGKHGKEKSYNNL